MCVCVCVCECVCVKGNTSVHSVSAFLCKMSLSPQNIECSKFSSYVKYFGSTVCMCHACVFVYMCACVCGFG